MEAKNLVGLRLQNCESLHNQFQISSKAGFSFVGVDLFPACKNKPKSCQEIDDLLPFVGSVDVHFENGLSMSECTVGYTSGWIDCDCPDEGHSFISQYALKKELAWAAHLSLSAIHIPLRHANNVKLAQLLTAFIKSQVTPSRFWITVPMCLPTRGDCEDTASSPWHWWNELVTLAGPTVSESLFLVLEVTPDLPEESVISRWISEPVAALALSTNLFISNSKGFPILSRPHQAILRRFLKLNAQVILTGESWHERGLVVYRQYINWIWKCTCEARSSYEKQSLGYENRLQEPLQPLQDNLSSATYDVFQMDPYKYKAYEEALNLALLSRSNPGGDGVNPAVNKQIIYILGAGQGPFVDASLQASRRSGCPIRIYVFEKNRNALLTLKQRLQTEWANEDVHLVPGDMRCLDKPPAEKADIFVSELLGSFGDNELSPECLDGAQHMLKDGGISIPASYTSYIAPLQSQHIHINALRAESYSKFSDRIQESSETPYVVRLTNCKILAAPQEAFTFTHPRKDLATGSNERYCTRTFISNDDGVIHGIAGYFEAVLYENVTLSILPDRHSPNMFSWFPMVFPLNTAIPVKAGQEIKLHLWRCVSPRHVWYEWAVTEPQTSKIHNSAGSAYKIGL
ncbi:unnamed protein product [Rodentolepis nana]|uniref:Protein arginine N-methyltransferase n=1 Tax=Rodentolepis nana TaxID=102285 RepID=A0A0R3TSE8_RODNA|nr:unnamed protein product [Rodentolepis nana]